MSPTLVYPHLSLPTGTWAQVYAPNVVVVVYRSTTSPARQRAANRSAGAFGSKTEDAAGVPANYDLSSSAQSMLNAPAVNAVPAFSEIAKRYGQLPGQGEIITNVSVGTLDDASAPPRDACSAWVKAYGPTTIVHSMAETGDYLQVSPATSTAWVPGPGAAQLSPFPYSLDATAAKR